MPSYSERIPHRSPVDNLRSSSSHCRIRGKTHPESPTYCYACRHACQTYLFHIHNRRTDLQSIRLFSECRVVPCPSPGPGPSSWIEIDRNYQHPTHTRLDTLDRVSAFDPPLRPIAVAIHTLEGPTFFLEKSRQSRISHFQNMNICPKRTY